MRVDRFCNKEGNRNSHSDSLTVRRPVSWTSPLLCNRSNLFPLTLCHMIPETPFKRTTKYLGISLCPRVNRFFNRGGDLIPHSDSLTVRRRVSWTSPLLCNRSNPFPLTLCHMISVTPFKRMRKYPGIPFYPREQGRLTTIHSRPTIVIINYVWMVLFTTCIMTSSQTLRTKVYNGPKDLKYITEKYMI